MAAKTITRHRVITYEEEIPTNLDGFRDWQFTSGPTTGEDFRIFAKKFHNYIKGQLPEGARMQRFSIGHYEVNGFIERGGKFAYFDISDVRHFPGEWHERILIRTAESDRDYTGGPNQSTSMEDFCENTARLLA